MSEERARHIDHPPRPMVQRLGAILWPSFFTAGVATMVFFAFVDPIDLAAITFPDLEITRELGYTVAFLGFWAGFASACTFTWLLLRPRSRFNHGRQVTEKSRGDMPPE